MTSYQESGNTNQRDHGDGLGCLVPLIGLTIALALAVTLVSWLWVDAHDEQPNPQDASVTETGDTTPREPAIHDQATVADANRYDPSGVSTQALLEAVGNLGWRSFGQPDVYDLGSQQRVAHKFRRNGERVRVIVHSYKSESASRTAIEEMDESAHTIQFDEKAVVLEPLDPASRQATASLAKNLRRFKGLLDEGDTGAPASN